MLIAGGSSSASRSCSPTCAGSRDLPSAFMPLTPCFYSTATSKSWSRRSGVMLAWSTSSWATALWRCLARPPHRSEAVEMLFWPSGRCWRSSRGSMRNSTPPCPSRCEGAYGIHLGPAVLGQVGGGRERGLTALGDSVNIASRLESLNKEFGSVLVASDAAVRASGLTFPAAELREISLRGRAEPLRVHVLHAPPVLMKAATSTRVARIGRE